MRAVRDRRGSLLLTLVCIAVLLLGLLGLAGSAGASSFSNTSEMLVADQALERLARLALDEAEAEVREDVERGGVWKDALTQSRLDGSSFTGLTDTFHLARTKALAADEQIELSRLTAKASLVQQNPFGVHYSGKLWGGDQTYGAIRIAVRAEMPMRGLLSLARRVEAGRLVSFRATLSLPPAPFDQSALWVRDPEFLRHYTEEVGKQITAISPAQAQALAASAGGLTNPLYGKLGKSSVRLELPAFGGLDGAKLLAYRDEYQQSFKSITDPGTQSQFRELFWMQNSDPTFGPGPYARADHVFRSQAELDEFLASPDGVARLDGIYYVQSPVTIDLRYSGRGAIVSPQKIEIVRAEKTADEDALMVVSTHGNVACDGAQGVLQAALVSVEGAVTGLAGKKVHGTVIADRLELSAGQSVEVALDPALESHQAGQMSADPSRLQVHFDPTPIAHF